MTRSLILGLAALLLMLTSCTSAPLKIPTEPIQPNEQELGPAEGNATGIMLFQLIPIKQNQRFVQAYQQALESQPGATRLVDVEIQERWFWAWVLNGYSFTVRGTAVK